MSEQELQNQIDEGVQFWCYHDKDKIIGVKIVMKKAVIILSVLALILNSCGGTSNRQADKSALADSLFIGKLTEHELITSRSIKFIGDSIWNFAGNSNDTDSEAAKVLKYFNEHNEK